MATNAVFPRFLMLVLGIISLISESRHKNRYGNIRASKFLTSEWAIGGFMKDAPNLDLIKCLDSISFYINTATGADNHYCEKG